MNAPTRRNLMTAALALATPLPALALAPAADPIFAAIEAHRQASAEQEAASKARDEAEAGLPQYWATNPIQRARWESDETIQAAVDRSVAAMDAEEAAMLAMLRTTPTTPEGRTALALYGCELTEAAEGTHCIGASAAHRILATFAGLPVLTVIDPDECEEA